MALVVGGAYTALVVVPHIKANKPAGNPAEVATKSYAIETLSIMTDLPQDRGGKPGDAYVFTTLLQAYKRKAEDVKTLNPGKLTADKKNALEQLKKLQEQFAKNELSVAEQYGKILDYYPESDLYGTGVSKEVASGRANEAINNLKKLANDIKNTASSDALQNVIICFESLTRSYQPNNCINQYAKLRQTVMKDIANQFQSQTAAHIKQQLKRLNS